ncbi:FitA-like ribbon-helix-helix domain-containing protein [Streptomyces mangrovi]|uniref:FitA-like ribbon-helix-helix domain-containing protein n=1 Tax=Streptomyces mangrovi TaxID=1206892 RepID=UPI00399D374A
MVALQIRDVPEEVRDALAARARENGQSLQAFLRALVVREASFSRNLELLREIEEWPGGGDATAEDVLAARDAARFERDAATGFPSGAGPADHARTYRDGGAA